MDLYHFCSKIVCGLTTINPRILVFSSKPDYSDNSRAFSDYLLSHSSYYKVFWRVSNPKIFKEKYSDAKVRFISDTGIHKYLNLFIYLRASYLFCTHSLSFYKGMKRKGQHLINLWHGCSYKDRVNKELHNKNYFFDKHLVAGPLFIDTKSYFFRCPDKSYILAKGYPRYDWLLHRDSNAMRLYRSIKGECSHLIIWMPTFRNDKDGAYQDMTCFTQFPLIGNRDDWDVVDEICSSYSVKLVIKLHVNQAEYDIEWQKFSNIVKISNEDIEGSGTNLYSFLSCTDALISDYSSVAVDYMIVDKPIGFVLDDFEAYKNARGFVVKNPLDYMPGHHLYSIQDLSGFIADVSRNNDIFKDARAKLYDVLLYRSSCYCKEIAESLGLNMN